MDYPKSPREHELEQMSRTYFRSKLPTGWRPAEETVDYGSDERVHIRQQGEMRSLELLVQLKGSDEPNGTEYETIEINVRTFNYLENKLQVVLVVKYVASENEAYWIKLRDVPLPNQNNETMTIRIPRENKLSTIDWQAIERYVEDVQLKKLAKR